MAALTTIAALAALGEVGYSAFKNATAKPPKAPAAPVVPPAPDPAAIAATTEAKLTQRKQKPQIAAPSTTPLLTAGLPPAQTQQKTLLGL